MQPPHNLAPAPYQLQLGCGTPHRPGWVSVNEDPSSGADLQAPLDDLSVLSSGSCTIIEACHVLQLMGPDQARGAIREWMRLLVPGGTLTLELPDMTRCLELIGSSVTGWDPGLMALFGQASPSENSAKWAWSPDSLESELRSAGFEEIHQVPMEGADSRSVSTTPHMRWVAQAPGVQPSTPASEDGDASFVNVFAWPNYSDAADLDHFFNVFARVLVDHDWVCLRLRVDPELDPHRDEVVDALEQSHGRVLGTEAALNVALFEGPLAPDEWVELGNSVEARIQLDHERGRQGFAEQMRTHVIQDAKALLDLVQLSQPSAPANRTGTGSAAKGQRDPIVPEATIEERIAALHPWQYPVTIEDATVQPGVGSGADPATIANRVAARSTLLVQELVARVDFRGKSILDLGCNCGFWSSFYAMAGANHVLGVDRDLRQVAQAELYWGANRFLPIHSYEFMQADFSQSSAWLAIREQGEVDIAVCVGALHQVENHTEALGWIAEATREFIILDTRVHHEPEGSGPVHVPNQAQLLQTLGDLGLETEILTPGFVDPVETAPSDSYSTGSRVVILARRTP